MEPGGESDATGIHPAGLGAVQETMLITLWARAAESRRSDAVVRDEASVRMAARLAYDFSRFDGGWKSQIGVAVRTRHMDDTVRAFIARHPRAVIVNLGAGLDTRFHRLDNGSIHWLEVDLPDAIALRRRMIAESERNPFIGSSALDDAWVQRVRSLGPRPIMIVSEGVLMFLEHERVRALVARLAADFPGGEMLFDTIGGLMVRLPWLHDTLPKTRAGFQWGLGGASELRTWSDRVEVVGWHAMLDESPDRWRWMRWLRYVPPLRRQFTVAHLRFRGASRPRQARAGTAA